jgi:voltage-gated potassium channel
MRDRTVSRAVIRLPRRGLTPVAAILRRVAYASIVIFVTFMIVWLGRDGYRDNAHPDQPLSVIATIYYTTVSLSTTGYGDIVPVTDGTRLVNALIVTPLRVVFLAILVGTAFEVLTQRTRDEFRINRWRSTLQGHYVVIGYGTKGRSAIATLLANGHPIDKFLVVDRNPDLIAEANVDGLAGLVGDATRSIVLKQAKLADAGYVVVAPDRDDTAVLITLTARQLSPTAVIVAAIREGENEPLIRQSGANAVITSSEAAGRLLGFAAQSPSISEVFADLLVHGSGLEIVERSVREQEVGNAPASSPDQVIAVVRAGTIIPFDAATSLTADDRLIVVRSQPTASP